jgi:hypothetical protein
MTLPIVRTREKTHGDWAEAASFIQDLKDTLRFTKNWDSLSLPQKEALELIATKLGRILYGDPDHTDHWTDIAGYAELGNVSSRPQDLPDGKPLEANKKHKVS